METIPISDEVADLVQQLGNFYTEVDREGEEAEENEVDRRPFTRPFAQHTGSLIYMINSAIITLHWTSHQRKTEYNL